jgi:hypothetical protein
MEMLLTLETAPIIIFFPFKICIRQILAIVFVFPQPGGPLIKVKAFLKVF